MHAAHALFKKFVWHWLCHAVCPQADDTFAWGSPEPTAPSQHDFFKSSPMDDADAGAEPDVDTYDLSLIIYRLGDAGALAYPACRLRSTRVKLIA